MRVMETTIPPLLALDDARVRLTRVGLALPPGLPFARWLHFMETLGGVHTATKWAIGDGLNYGEHEYGEKYSQAAARLRVKPETLMDWAWVSRSVPISLRNEVLSFSHHRAVARLPEEQQRAWLRDAITHSWGANTLRAMIQGDGALFEPPAEDGAGAVREALSAPDGLPDELDDIDQHPQVIATIAKQIARAKEDHQLLNSSASNEYYTPLPILDAARELLGAIDLDPASSEDANRTVRAARYYAQDEDGLAQPWAGRVWLNPPYGIEGGESNQARWSRRLLAEYAAGAVTEALLLVNAVPGNRWFVPLKRHAICFPDERVRFSHPLRPSERSQPTQSNAIVYLGPQVARFAAIFERFGAVLARRDVWPRRGTGGPRGRPWRRRSARSASTI